MVRKNRDVRWLITAELTETVPASERKPYSRVPETRKHYAFAVHSGDGAATHAEQMAAGLHARKSNDLRWRAGNGRMVAPVLSDATFKVMPYKSKVLAAHKGRSDATAQEIRTRMAIAYARWLAARDGVAIPATKEKPMVNWGLVYAPGASRGENHARSVSWGHFEEQRNLGNLRGTFRVFVPDVTIEIPNWDFVAAEPIEETIPEEMPEFLEAAE